MQQVPGTQDVGVTTPRRSIAGSEIAPDEVVDSDSESDHRPSDVHLRPNATPPPQFPPGDPNFVPPLASWADAKQFFITEGNWQYLLGTSLAWLFLDFACKQISA
jgi:PHS family inorganic phosphate transporter-like MFS transporter